MTPTAITCTRYFLDIADRLLPVEEAGHCTDYWRMWTQAGQMERNINACTDTHFEPAMREKLALLRARMNTHTEACPVCRAWLARCEMYVKR